MFKGNNNQYMVSCLLDCLKIWNVENPLVQALGGNNWRWGLLSIKESKRVYWCKSWHINNGQSNILKFSTYWQQNKRFLNILWSSIIWLGALSSSSNIIIYKYIIFKLCGSNSLQERLHPSWKTNNLVMRTRKFG